MAGRWQWRAAVLATVAVAVAAFPVRADAGGHDDDDRERERRRGAATIDRINPDLDGDRVVFTQIEQRRGTTSRSVWSRDLRNGRETLLAEVGTGEPYPAASGSWTAWSEQTATGHLVRAKSLDGRRVLDVFSTDFTPFELSQFPGPELLSVDVSGTTVVVPNGPVPALGGTEDELVRVSLPQLRRTFVDVTSTAEPIPVRVAQSGPTTVAALSSTALFSVVDGAGNVVVSPVGGDCTPYFGGVRPQPAIDGDRIAMAALCLNPAFGSFTPAVLTCTLPCDEVAVAPLDVTSGLPTWVSVSGHRVAWSAFEGAGPSPTHGIYVLDTEAGGPPVLVHRTSGVAGPKVSLSGDRLAWDQTVLVDGAVRRAIYVRNLAAGVTTVLRPGERRVEVVPEATGPLRLNPDVRGRTLAYAELARDGSSAGVWTRSLGGSPTLVSTAATDATVPRLGDGWLAWNTRDPGAVVERVVASTGAGAPLVDVYTTDLAPYDGFFTPDNPARARVDVGGARAVVSGYTVDPAQNVFLFPQLSVFSKDLPNGPLQYLAPVTPPEVRPFAQALFGKTNGRFTAAVEDAFPIQAVDLFDETGMLRQVPIPSTSPFGPSCFPTALDLSATQLVVAVQCFGPGETSALLSCLLPCTGGLTDRLAIPPIENPVSPGFPQSPSIGSLSVHGSTVVVSYQLPLVVGQAFAQFTAIDRYDLRRRGRPVRVATTLGTVGAPQVDDGTITWSVDQWEGGRTGTVYVHDIRRGRTSRI